MKTTTIITILAMTTTLAADSFAAEFQTDTFKTKGGKEVVITAIKHARTPLRHIHRCPHPQLSVTSNVTYQP